MSPAANKEIKNLPRAHFPTHPTFFARLNSHAHPFPPHECLDSQSLSGLSLQRLNRQCLKPQKLNSQKLTSQMLTSQMLNSQCLNSQYLDSSQSFVINI